MLYSQFIDRLRAEAKDSPKPMHNDFTGDGTTVIFAVTDKPVLEDSYTLIVNGVQKIEGTDFSINKEEGIITMASAPTNGHAITFDYQYVHLTNSSWITIVNRILSDMSGEFFREIVDDDFGDSVADQSAYSCPTRCIDVVNAWYRTSDNDQIAWRPIAEYTNWRYSADLNKILLGRPFSVSTYPIRLNYLKSYELGSVLNSTLDIQEKYEGVLQLGCMWKFYDYRLGERVEVTTKIAKERTITPLQNLQALSAHYYKLYLKEKGRRKPTKPLRVLTSRRPEGGTP